MLSKEEFGLQLKYLELSTRLNLPPLKIDKEKAQVSHKISRRRKWIWRLVFIYVVCHCLFSTFRLLQSLLRPPKLFNLEHMIVHGITNGGVFLLNIVSFVLFIQGPELTDAIFNCIFTTDQLAKDDSKSKFKSRRDGVRKYWKIFEFSLQELFILYFPFLVNLMIATILLLFIYDPSRSQMIYSVLPSPEFQNVYTLSFTLVLELVMFSFAAASANFCFVTQLLFFNKLDSTFSNMAGDLRNLQAGRKIRAFCGVKRCYAELRRLQLLTQLFNESQLYITLLIKITTLTVSILAGFGLVRYHHKSWLLTSFCLCLFIGSSLVFIVVFDRAFSIPRAFSRVKHQMIFLCRIKKLPADMVKEIKSIPNVGIQQGRFHKFERTSTPKFIIFVVFNLTRMLVTFRKFQ